MSNPKGAARGPGFQSRLNRMEARRAPIEAAKPQVEVLPDWKANFKRPMTLAAAVFVGMLAVFIARLARFHLLGSMPARDIPDVTMFIDGGIAMVCSFLIIGVLKFKDRAFKAAYAVGIVAMVGMMHNFVHAAPGVFGLLFSKEWTAVTVAYSEPDSIFLLNKYVVVLPSDGGIAGEPGNFDLPKVRRYGLISNGD